MSTKGKKYGTGRNTDGFPVFIVGFPRKSLCFQDFIFRFSVCRNFVLIEVQRYTFNNTKPCCALFWNEGREVFPRENRVFYLLALAALFNVTVTLALPDCLMSTISLR